MLYAIIAVLVVLADQMIKLYVSAEGFKPIHLIPGILNLGVFSEAGEPVAPFHANTGGAFGLLGGQVPTYWFIIIAGVFTVLVLNSRSDMPSGLTGTSICFSCSSNVNIG